jgi:hypothetical protein
VVLIVPIKIKIKYETKIPYKEDKQSNQNQEEATNSENENKMQNELLIDNYIGIYILNFIRVKKIKIVKKEEKKVIDIVYNVISFIINYSKMAEVLFSLKDLKKISNNIYFKKLYLNMGINFKDAVLNAYTIAFINTIISMYIARNTKKINIKDISYNTYLSKNICDLNLDCIIKFNLVNTISIIFKIINKYRKVVNENVRTTSNRELNDDSDDLTREYDRC